MDGEIDLYIWDRDLHYYIEVKKPLEKKEVETNKAFTKTGLKVIFYLLNFPEAINLLY